MSQEPRHEHTFYLGLCMAGAVSAGAYTAGVIDYLTEALENYEKVRGQKGFPRHAVRIPVMGGASAGGMTSIITAAAAQQGLHHVRTPQKDPQAEIKDNILYHSWVDLTSADMFPVLMDNDDIEPGEVYSLFNSNFIKAIADRVLKPTVPPADSLPTYFCKNMKVFVTLSNLQGFCYNVAFKASSQDKAWPYYMQIHNDYACFQICNNGTTKADPGWIPLNLVTGQNIDIAIDAAMATGAFPVGLRSRLLKRPSAAVNNNPFLKQYLSKDPVPGEEYTTLNVDGGMINNEPFEYVRQVLETESAKNGAGLTESYDTFNSSVVMIAPFPSVKPSTITLGEKLIHSMGLTFSAMRSQMRAKSTEYVDAMDPSCPDLFLIDPSRTNGILPKIQGQKAIACGALDGFSGFLSKDFRIHDYFLGRYNCYVFLREYFTVPESSLEDNPIFKYGYGDPDIDKSRFRARDGGYQILPIVDEQPPVEPEWPVQDWSTFSRFKEPIKERAEALLLNLFKLSPVRRTLLWIGSRVILRGLLAKAALNRMYNELTDWKLLKGQPEQQPKVKDQSEIVEPSSTANYVKLVILKLARLKIPVAELEGGMLLAGLNYNDNMCYDLVTQLDRFVAGIKPGAYIDNADITINKTVKEVVDLVETRLAHHDNKVMQ